MKDLTYTEIANKIKSEDIMVGKYYLVAEIDIALSNGFGGLRNKYLDKLCGMAYNVYIDSDYNVVQVAEAMEHLIQNNNLADITIDKLYDALEDGDGYDW